MSKFLDATGLAYFKGKIATLLAGKVDKVDGKGLSTEDYTSAEKTKLSGIAESANNYTHPSYTAKSSGFYKVTVDNKGHVSAATAVAKADITGLGIPAQDTTYSAATTTAAGLMSADDKSKLDGIAAQANKYTLPTASASTLGGIKVGTNLSISNGVLSATNTTYGVATGSVNGLMSSTDKTKLDGFSAASAYALKTDLASMYKYKGSKATFADLPTTGNVAGDVWNVETDGQNYAWTGSAWDSLGGIFSIDAITNTEIDDMFK